MNPEILTDDEILRVQGMTDGTKNVGKLKLRPMTPLSLSWCQRNDLFDDSVHDPMHKTAAYVFLHTEPKGIIRAVVNNKQAFANAVDDWIEDNVKNHVADLEPYTEEMNLSMQKYLAAISHSKNIGTGGSDAPKN
jgi:hypothetical protein